MNLSDYIQFFSKSVGILSYSGKIFDNGLQFSYSPETIRNEFSLLILRRLSLKGTSLIGSEKEVERGSEEGESGARGRETEGLGKEHEAPRAFLS